MGMESKTSVELMTPLSAKTYLEAYYDQDTIESDTSMKTSLQKFLAQDLITIATLQETWPDGEWQEIEDEPMLPEEEASPVKTSTLRDRSMDMLLNRFLDQPEDYVDLLAEAEGLTDFIPKLRLKLGLSIPAEKSSSYLGLVEEAFEGAVELDLQPFFGKFSLDEIVGLVARLYRKGTLRVLNLSNLPELSESDLAMILGIDSHPEQLASASTPTLTTSSGKLAVILLETPKISIDFVTKNLGNTDVCHSELFRRPFNEEGSYRSDDEIPALEFNAPSTVSQLVWVGISSIQSRDSKLRQDDGLMNWSSLNYSVEASSTFSGNKAIKYKNFLMDIPSPAGKIIHGLKQLLHFLRADVSWFPDWPKAAARCFATSSISTPSVTEAEGHFSVGPMSTTFYQDSDRYHCVASGKGRTPKVGHWVIVLVHEAFDAKDQAALDKRELDSVNTFGPRGTEERKEFEEKQAEPTFKPLKRLRYAFAKRLAQSESGEQQFLITDVPGYINQVMGKDSAEESEVKRLSDWWKAQISGFDDDAQYYADIDMPHLLRKIYVGEAVSEERARPIDPFEDIMSMMVKMRHGDA